MVGARRIGVGSVRRAVAGVAVALAMLALGAQVVGAQAGRTAFDEGVRLMRANEVSKAEKQFEKAISAEPKVGEYHLWLGRAVGQQASSASTLRQPFLARRIKASFERAVELDPTLIEAREGLITFYLQAPGVMGGSVAKAREQAREIAKLDAPRGLLADASIAWDAKDTVATERAFRTAIAAAPDSVLPVILLAQRQEAWGRVPAAFGTLDAFLARRPGDIAATFRVGRLAATSGQELPRGEAALRRLAAAPEWEAATGRPSRAAVRYRLGMILEKTGRKPEARTEYEAALTLDPSLKVVKDALAALKD